MTEFLSSLSQPFMLRALIVGTVISVCAALLGVILVLKRYALIGHGLADIGFASLSLAIALGWSPLYVSMPIVAVASFAIMLISQKSGGNGDTAIGVVSTGALSVGIIITYLAGGMNVDVYSYMFGSILGTTDADLYLSIPLGLVVIAAFILLYNRLFMVTYDEVYAKACGINVTLYRYLGVMASGALGGLGGLVFVVPTSTNFNATVAGYGFLALAVLIFGQWKPMRILVAALFFGFMKTIAATYSGISFLQSLPIPSDIYKMIPYVATLVVLAFASKNSQAPKACGVPYDRGSR